MSTKEMKSAYAHIAGIGRSEASPNAANLHKGTLVAGTKALLDAGATYGDVDQSVACFLDNLRIPRSAFKTFGLQGAPIAEVDNQSGLYAAIQHIRSGQSNCALVIGFDKEPAKGTQIIAVVLVSDLFLKSHAYLRDGAVCVRALTLTSNFHSRSLGGSDSARTANTAIRAALRQADLGPKDIQVLQVRQDEQSHDRPALNEFDFTPAESSGIQETFAGTTGLAGLCALVWQLRGWSGDPPSRILTCLQYTSGPDGVATVAILRRSDGRPALAWSDVENVRDGRERLGYNPAAETRDITGEDLAAVRSRAEFTLDDVTQLQLPLKGGDRAALARL